MRTASLLASTAILTVVHNNDGNISEMMRNIMMTTPPAPLNEVVAGISAANVAATDQIGGASVYRAEDIEKRSSDSAAMCEYWDKTDAIVEGHAAVMLGREKYLPKFPQEKPADYNDRLANTKFTNVYRDIVEGLANKPFEEEISLLDPTQDKDDPDSEAEIPQEFTDFIENVDGAGNNLTVFASLTFFNGINSAIDWIFVDAPKPDPSIKTRADEKAAGIQPYWSHVLGRNVLQAVSEMIFGKETLVYIRILEPGNGSPDNIRIFKRDAATGLVVWWLYEKQSKRGDDGKPFYIIIDAGSIDIGVIPLVPFITGRRDGRTFKIFPAMRDAADLQIELYQQESGLKWIKNLAAYPMLAANGIKPDMMPDGKTPMPIAVRPGMVLYSKPDAKGVAGQWAFIEPAATSMKFLADDVKDTIQNLRELGRQPLTAQTGNLTTITTAIAAGKAKSAVGAWAYVLKDALENAMKITAQFKKMTFEAEVFIYTEFDDVMDDGKDLQTLNIARAAGDLSQPTYWSELKRRKVLSPEFNSEAEEKLLLLEAPADPLNPNGTDAGELDANGNPVDPAAPKDINGEPAPNPKLNPREANIPGITVKISNK